MLRERRTSFNSDRRRLLPYPVFIDDERDPLTWVDRQVQSDLRIDSGDDAGSDAMRFQGTNHAFKSYLASAFFRCRIDYCGGSVACWHVLRSGVAARGSC